MRTKKIVSEIKSVYLLALNVFGYCVRKKKLDIKDVVETLGRPHPVTENAVFDARSCDAWVTPCAISLINSSAITQQARSLLI